MCFRPPAAKKWENKCPKCETVNPEDVRVCQNCGEPLPEPPLAPGVSAAVAVAGAPPPGQSVGGTPPKAPPVPPMPPKAPPAPPKAPPPPPKKPG
jgi:hypothetical protein